VPQAPELEDGEQYADIRFRTVRMHGRKIRNVQFSDCTFDHCTFGGATFASCTFTGCTFDTCDLSLMQPAGSRFMDVRFVDSKLVGVDWTRVDLVAKMALTVVFERCVVSQALFNGLNLRRLRLVDSVASEADFSNADMSDSVCTGTDFAGARFSDTNFTSADLRRARGYRINPLANRVAKAKFTMPDAVGLLDGLGVVIE